MRLHLPRDWVRLGETQARKVAEAGTFPRAQLCFLLRGPLVLGGSDVLRQSQLVSPGLARPLRRNLFSSSLKKIILAQAALAGYDLCPGSCPSSVCAGALPAA